MATTPTYLSHFLRLKDIVNVNKLYASAEYTRSSNEIKLNLGMRCQVPKNKKAKFGNKQFQKKAEFSNGKNGQIFKENLPKYVGKFFEFHMFRRKFPKIDLKGQIILFFCKTVSKRPNDNPDLSFAKHQR